MLKRHISLNSKRPLFCLFKQISLVAPLDSQLFWVNHELVLSSWSSFLNASNSRSNVCWWHSLETEKPKLCLRELVAFLHYSRIKAWSLPCESTKQAVPSESRILSAVTKVLKKHYVQLLYSLNYFITLTSCW